MHTATAMILAGGRGTRMDIFCQQRPKPVLPFGGQQRVIDFTLDNCLNSGISDIAALVDYQRYAMADYLTDWNSRNRPRKNLSTLHPAADSFTGTADAVYRNLDFIQERANQLVLILAGDHIYRMDYRQMFAFHQSSGADVTVGVIRVPREQAGRFGTVIIDESGRIKEFEEKSPQPRSTLASMGIYVFNAGLLRQRLVEDAAQPDSVHDFGYSILPRLVKRDRVFAFEFKDYWQDIGTVEAYYEANMALLKADSAFKLGRDWPLLSSGVNCCQKGPGQIVNSLISPDCVIKGYVENSVLSPGVYVEERAEVINSIVMYNARIGYHSIVDRCILDEDVDIGRYCHIGFGHLPSGEWDVTMLGKEACLPDHSSVGRKCKILPGTGLKPEHSMRIPAGPVIPARS